MHLKTFRYSELEGTPQEWRIEPVHFGPITLLVGKNASGKSRTLNVINGIARMIAGDAKLDYESGDYEMEFADGPQTLRYCVRYSEKRVVMEQFFRDSTLLLKREEGGFGTIYAEKEHKNIDFQTPDTEIAAVARLDSIQHSFLEPLNKWGKGTWHFAFGTPMGKDNLAVFVKERGMPVDPKNVAQVVGLFRRGEKDHGRAFVDAVIADMAQLGYDIETIGVHPVQVAQSPVGPIEGLYAKEKDRRGDTEQMHMSQGMFRALAVIIHLNYAEHTTLPSCILIDDIGEGLDYDRSCSLIDIVIHKATKAETQLIMSTNDRFVMNRVPLEHWSIISRKGETCSVSNYENSRQKFEDFKFTGLSNFDLFATDFLNSSAREETSDIR